MVQVGISKVATLCSLLQSLLKDKNVDLKQVCLKIFIAQKIIDIFIL